MKSKVLNESMNSSEDQLDDHCTMFLFFDIHAKKLLHYPYSICGSYDGRHVCSHFARFLFLIRCVQHCDFPQDYFENSLPSNPTDFQNKTTLIENVGKMLGKVN